MPARKIGPPTSARLVALLRGVNVGGNKAVPMASLRAMAMQLGWTDVATYLQSGNLVFTAVVDVVGASKQLERALAEQFDFTVPVVIRRGEEFARDVAACPFPEAATERPQLVHVGYSREPLRASMANELTAYCTAGERVIVREQAMWIDFVGGVARAKLTSAVLDRVVGGIVTLRNLKSARAIAALVG